MKVCLVSIDANPNIAIEKLRMYHESIGDEVICDPADADKVYVSVIFTKNRYKAEYYKKFNAEIGGTGWDISKKLQIKIDNMKPKINYGFTSRGCIRLCPFCFVPEKEGKLMATGDIYDIWDGKSKSITLLDNNILALSTHFNLIAHQIRSNNLYVDFNQGLDARVATDEQLIRLKALKHKTMYRFSWDNDYDMSVIFMNIHKHLGACMVYVFVGKLSDPDYVWHRLNTLKRIGHRPYLMREEGVDKRWNNVARWVNQFWCFQKYTYQEFCYADKEYNRKKKEQTK